MEIWVDTYDDLAERIAKYHLSEDKLRHILFQKKLSEIFSNIPLGIDDFSEDDFFTGLRKYGLKPDDFPYDESACRYKIKMKNHTFYLFCTEFITFFHQNAYHISVDEYKEDFINVTSCASESVLNALCKADKDFPQWESQWPEIYRNASKTAKEYGIATKSIEAIVGMTMGRKGLKFSIEHRIGVSKIAVGRQTVVIMHNDFMRNQEKVITEISNFAELQTH